MKSKENAADSPYLVYSRKFRPQDLAEVVGQDPIVRTLKNGIAQNRIPQNFLFSGPRGVGKTSTARIIAKILNCEKGKEGEPCDKCPSCLEIIQGNAMDVLEIDGASNRGIDEIRNLRETVKFKPVSGRYKIYIIDEVHMLTTEAFNALLKTLEEPPPHVKFMFATTESHKVPLTILSRCQRFNFKRISTQDIVKKLEEIVKKEKLKADKKALYLMARAADGALRDAEGLLDQLVSFSEGEIREVDVLAMLGLASEDVYFALLDEIKAKNAKGIFAKIEELYDNGVDMAQLARGLFELIRSLLLIQYSEEAGPLGDLSPEAVSKLKERKSIFTKSELLLAINMLNNLQSQIRRNLAPPRLLVETTLLKLLVLDEWKSVESVLQEGASLSPASAPATAQPALPRAMSAAPAPQRPTSAKSVIPVSTASASTPGSLSINQIESVWPKVIEFVKAKKMSNGIFLSESSPVELAGSTVTLAFPPEFGFHKEMLEKDANRKLVEEAFQANLGARVTVQFVIARPEEKEKVSSQGAEDSEPPPPEDGGKLPDIISDAMNIFDGARIVRKDP